ncbi:hypothetical protein PPYC1_03740 [Paenibacillus polymyxa]|nr:hypothetical protein PPYC1_03740 [Paenibacillus polymyxa]
MIFRSLLQWDSSDCIRHLKVRIPLQRRTLTLLQIQPLRSATARRKVTLFPKWCGAWEGQKDLNTQKLKSFILKRTQNLKG